MTRTRATVPVRMADGHVEQMTDGGSIDLDEEVVLDSHGQRYTEADVEQIVESIEAQPRGRGRPSLSGSGTSSVVRARMPEQLRAALAARAYAESRTESELIREALEAYLVTGPGGRRIVKSRRPRTAAKAPR